ncbi:hypothetical protein NDU88_006656 [Pleurodeles waltl]|uniref:Uncharacterized protein n=1 Tax=Pleurodeles waltl TaxID=8319 RepID=A0AAV7U033_PLEWA|nr:hypothetical protein NDU88_006656 [Pleurodeles waltl]
MKTQRPLRQRKEDKNGEPDEWPWCGPWACRCLVLSLGAWSPAMPGTSGRLAVRIDTRLGSEPRNRSAGRQRLHAMECPGVLRPTCVTCQGERVTERLENQYTRRAQCGTETRETAETMAGSLET